MSSLHSRHPELVLSLTMPPSQTLYETPIGIVSADGPFTTRNFNDTLVVGEMKFWKEYFTWIIIRRGFMGVQSEVEDTIA